MTTPYRLNGATTTTTNGQWYQFDPNVHYYYDEQGHIHYYDPNTNQECFPYTPISRQTTPDVLLPCPDPHCTGENKPRSKFCEECGRPLTMSRSATPLSSVTRALSLQQISDPYALQRSASPRPVMNQQMQENDFLARKKGCPIVAFGFGGKIVVSFPQRVPDYYTSTIHSRPGPIKIKQLKEYCQPSSFPGPILHDSKVGIKQKKKDVAAYITQRLEIFEKEKTSLLPASAEYHKLEAKMLLWQLMKVYVETDGHIDDKDKMDQAILDVLRPSLPNEDDTHFTLPAQNNDTLYETDDDDLSDRVLSKIERYLMRGDRAGAVNYAMQEDLWAHALIISSCVGKDLWQQVISSFVDREMNATAEMRRNRTFHNIAGSNQPLRVLYCLFSGVGSAAMKEFILNDIQYVNAPYCPATAKPVVDVKQLSRWRDTIAIILANRTLRDSEALTALGDIMKEHGWIDAAHICYLLSPQTAIHSGIDMMNVRLTLIGSDMDCDLTEIYEFSHHLKHSGCLPFLQGYKLARAWTLADLGYLDEARRYYEAIDEAVRSHIKSSPYLHQPLIDQLSAFKAYLENASGRKSSVDPSSWLKPNFQKRTLTSLWGTLEGSFTKFVSGEELPAEDAAPARKSTEIMGRYN
ncbi:hypothetical protein BCV72DRAFT_308677 [Rhizopus microsporus var. microsporus]|uniref:Protein transport protein sec16 n=1 Tax=Rhizopus microsporus var. microsporus TaxID=86635 RepID=A0A1X0QT51_RHIZD|nr:hypothetical protein BCV72DRAFT_308677 [Rhizopus microsporus var. microsporus]